MKFPDNSDMDLKEQKDHGTASFPCGLYEIFEVTGRGRGKTSLA